MNNITYELQWLQDYVTDSLGLRPDTINSADTSRKDIPARDVCIAIITAYSGKSMKELAAHYNIPYSTVCRAVLRGITYSDYRWLNAELQKLAVDRSPFGIAR